MESKCDFEKESRNKSIDCKTLFVSVWDAVMKLTAVGKYHFSSDIRNFKNIKLPPPPPPPPSPHFLYCIQFLRTSACVCRTSENCKSPVLQGKCKIEIFLSPGLLHDIPQFLIFFIEQLFLIFYQMLSIRAFGRRVIETVLFRTHNISLS